VVQAISKTSVIETPHSSRKPSFFATVTFSHKTRSDCIAGFGDVDCALRQAYKVSLTFTDWQETLSGDDFLRLRQTHLDLSRAFAADAEVVFLTRIFFLKPPSLIYTALVRIAQPLGGERADVEAAIRL
jgi:hypothetical protein